MMASPNARRIHTIAGRLRYRTLAQVIGRTVRVESEATVVTDVLSALESLLPGKPTSGTRPEAVIPAMAKYGLIDLEWSMPAEIGAALPRLPLRELRELGVVFREKIPEDDGCMTQLLEELRSGQVVLKLILDAVDDERSPDERLHHLEAGLPRDYLPRPFRVRDAAITNGPLLWLERNFYL